MGFQWKILIVLYANVILASNTVVLKFPDSSSVNDSIIRLFDIAQISSDNKELVNQVSNVIAGTAAPPGFSRLLSIEDMLMYRIQPRFSGTKFITDGSKRVSVKTTSTTCSISEIVPLIEKYLDTALSWNDGEWSFELAKNPPVWRGYNAPYEVYIDGLRSRNEKGNTSVNCNFVQGGKKSVLQVICLIRVTTNICTVKANIPRGSVLSAEDIEFIGRDITFCAPGFFTRKEDLKGSKTVVTINAGTIIQSRMVCKVPDITSGDNVQIIYNKGRIRCSVIGIARESGHTGEKIWVQNNETQQLIRVKILSKGIVEIA